MHKVKWKKLFLKLFFIILAIYLLCLIFCTIAVYRMQTISYNSSGFGVVLEEYELNFEENSAVLNYYDFDGNLTDSTEVVLTSAQEMKIRLACAVSFMPVWRSRYVNPFINDGNQWTLTITYQNKEKEIYGSNRRPLTYHLVDSTIKHIFEETN